MKTKIKIGDVGRFANANGKIFKCVVRGFDSCPWNDDVLLVDYVMSNGRRASTMISREGFIPDYPRVSLGRKVIRALQKVTGL